jgi:hypothetical protein
MLRLIVLYHLLSGLMISPYMSHIHITSQIFTVSNLPGGFRSEMIQSCIACVTKTDKALLNESNSHDRNIRHIFFEPKILRSCRQMSIMQCNMRNQYSDLFICIMDYLHVLCMIIMILSYVLYMIYIYYRLFACTNLVDVISLFSQFFRYIYRFRQNSSEIFEKKTGQFSVFQVFTVPPSSPMHFDRIFLNFIIFFKIFKNQRNRQV